MYKPKKLPPFPPFFLLHPIFLGDNSIIAIFGYFFSVYGLFFIAEVPILQCSEGGKCSHVSRAKDGLSGDHDHHNRR